MRDVNFEAGAKSVESLLRQLDESNYEDIAKYRSMQLAIEEEINGTEEYQDLDFVLSSNIDNYESANLEELHLPPNMTLEQVHERYSEKIEKELETYRAILKLLDPKKITEETSEEKLKYDSSGTTRLQKMYETVRRDYKNISRAVEETI